MEYIEFKYEGPCLICNTMPAGHDTLTRLCPRCGEKLLEETEKEKEAIAKTLNLPKMSALPEGFNF